MRSIRGFSFFVLSACLVATTGTHVFAGDGEKATAKAKNEAHRGPARPGSMGAPREADLPDASYGSPNNDTITRYQNELGQTVYSIAASHFDVSPPLREMVAAAGSDHAMTDDASSDDLARPASRLVGSGAPLAGPTVGFNFAGIPSINVVL